MHGRVLSSTAMRMALLGCIAHTVGCAGSNPGVAEDAGPDGTRIATVGGDAEDSMAATDSGDAEAAQEATDSAHAETGADARADADPGADASIDPDASDPLNSPPRCTSGVTWNGVTEDQNMRPGEA